MKGRTWSYDLADYESDNVRALINDVMVEDTAGIDRAAARVPLKFSLAPGVFNRQNALAWFYYLTMLIPIVALGWVVADWWAGRVARPEAAAVTAAAILCCIISHTLVRDDPGNRLVDAIAPILVLTAWLVRRRDDPGGSLLRMRLRRAGMVSLFLVTCWSVGSVGGTGPPMARSDVLGSGQFRLWEQLGVVNRALHRRPIDEWAPPGSTGLRGITRYIHDCTAPSDRILVAWFEPGVFFYAERGFAGGQPFLFDGNSYAPGGGGFHASLADQRLTIERMQRQSVPIILGRRDYEEEFRLGFPLIYDYVQARYELAEGTLGEEPSVFLVFVDTRLDPVAEHPDLGLPCYR